MELNSILPIELCLYIERILLKHRLFEAQEHLRKNFIRYKGFPCEPDGFTDATKLYPHYKVLNNDILINHNYDQEWGSGNETYGILFLRFRYPSKKIKNLFRGGHFMTIKKFNSKDKKSYLKWIKKRGFDDKSSFIPNHDKLKMNLYKKRRNKNVN